MELVQTMEDSFSFVVNAEELKKYLEAEQGIIKQILHQVMECAYFIRDYCRGHFGMRKSLFPTYSKTDHLGPQSHAL